MAKMRRALEPSTFQGFSFDFVVSLGETAKELFWRQLVERRLGTLERQLRQTLSSQPPSHSNLEDLAVIGVFDRQSGPRFAID